ncbi:MAG: prephenate dehydratase [Tahibacter sp.]
MNQTPHDEPLLSTLSGARERIDAIDRSIQELIAERARWAQQVGKAKGPLKAAVDYYRPEREAQVLRMVLDRNQGPLSNEEMVRLFREIMSACLAQQEPLKIGFLGPEGTFSQQAVLKHFGHSIKGLPLATIDEVFQEVQAGNADFGVVPIENSSEGTVNSSLDLFVSSPLKICGEIELRIHQNLLSRSGRLEDIERVYSHPQSLGQCKAWLRANLPKAERIPVSSNAEAARRARNSDDAAAIAGETAAHIYALKFVGRQIEDQPDNTTRFFVIGRELFSASGHDKTSLLMSVKDRPGALYELLTPLAEHGLSMTKIESRPARTGKWEYVFFVEVEGHVEDPRIASAIDAARARTAEVKVLGSYPVALL